MNPGYGAYAVHALSSLVGADRVDAKEDGSIASKPSFVAIMIGRRTWKDVYVVHPKAGASQGLPPKEDDASIFLHLQRPGKYGKAAASPIAKDGGKETLLTAAIWGMRERGARAKVGRERWRASSKGLMAFAASGRMTGVVLRVCICFCEGPV